MRKLQFKLKEDADSKTISLANYDIVVDGKPLSSEEARNLIDIQVSLKAGELPNVHFVYSNVEIEIDADVESEGD